MHPFMAKAIAAGVIVGVAWGLSTLKEVLLKNSPSIKTADDPDPDRVKPAAPKPADSSTEPAKRGRPPGAKNKAKAEEKPKGDDKPDDKDENDDKKDE